MKNKIEQFPLHVLKIIFPNKNNIDFTKLQLTTEGIYSVSIYRAGLYLRNIISKYFKRNNITITDGTGNCGADTIMFGLFFKNVNSIELNNTNFKALKNNIKQYNLNNVKLFKGSCINIIPTLKRQNCIYIDAPWNGTDYKNNISIKLYLDNKELSEIYYILYKYTELLIFKVPVNYDFTYFIQNTHIRKYYIDSFIDKYTNIRFYYIFISTF